MRVGLVACSARKLDRPAPARKLYTGTLFRLAIEYVEQVCDRWYILSGEYGLVDPDQVLPPYNRNLRQLPADWRWAWASGVLAALHDRGLNGHTQWIVLAGEPYREFLVPGLKGEVNIPLVGLGIGQQIAHLKRLLAEVNSQ